MYQTQYSSTPSTRDATKDVTASGLRVCKPRWPRGTTTSADYCLIKKESGVITSNRFGVRRKLVYCYTARSEPDSKPQATDAQHSSFAAKAASIAACEEPLFATAAFVLLEEMNALAATTSPDNPKRKTSDYSSFAADMTHLLSRDRAWERAR